MNFLCLDTNDFDFFQAFIVNEILDNGFNAAVQGYLQAQVTFNYNSMAEFETECELFSYHGEEMARIGKNYASKNMTNSLLPDQIIPLFLLFTV